MTSNPAFDIKVDPASVADAYREILELGLENLQRAALPELHWYLRIEIDHLHNIPKYMASDWLFHHADYFCRERPSYLEDVQGTAIIDVEFMLARYQTQWDALHRVMLPYADAINSMNLYTALQ